MNTKKTTPNAIPVEIYNELYDFLCDNIAYYGECDEDGNCHYGFEFESEDGRYYISGCAVSSFEYEDDSFDHAFGTEHCGHWEFDKIEEVVTEQCLFIDNEENETEVEFDSEIFDHLHDETTIKRGGVEINQGDEVIAKPRFLRWTACKFLYFDTIDRCYYVEIGKYQYRCDKVLPATEKNRELVGTY